MKLDFVKNTKRNIFASAVSRGLALLFPFLNRSLFLWLMGSEYLGLNGLFTSIIGGLSLAELGFGTAIVCSMYKPIAEDDRETVCAYLRFYRTIYRWIGAIILVAGLCLLPFLRHLVKGTIPPDINLHILYLLHLSNTAVSYFLFAYRSSILAAHHRNDVQTNIDTLISLLQYLTVFMILIFLRNYYLYVITTVVYTMIRNLLIMRESKRLFPYIEPRGDLDPEKKRHVLSDVKSIFMHRIGGYTSTKIDNLVISAFMGLGWVATYGNYFYVYTNVAGLPSIVYSGMMGGFGNKLNTESKDKNFELFMRVYRMTGIIIIWCTTLMLALYQPFIRGWMREKQMLVQPFITSALFVALFYINQSRQVLLTFKGAAGLWREDRWKPVAGAAVKLLISLLSVLFLDDRYKLDGVIISSIIGYVVVQIPWESHVVFSKFFDRQKGKYYWLQQLKFAMLAIIPCAITLAVVQPIPLERTRGLIVKGIVASVVSTAVMLIIFRKDLIDVVKKVLRRA